MSNISISFNENTKKTELFFKNELTLSSDGQVSEADMIHTLSGYVLSGLGELEKSIKHLQDNLSLQKDNTKLEELMKELKGLAELQQEIDLLQSK